MTAALDGFGRRATSRKVRAPQGRVLAQASRGDSKESATESKPPAFARARVKGCGKSAPGRWRQGPHGKPHSEQGRTVDASAGNQPRQGCPSCCLR